MSRDGKFVVITSVIWLAANEAIVAHRRFPGVLLGLLLSFVFLVVSISSVALVFKEWRQRHWRALLPLAACVLAVVIFIPLGELISAAVLAWSFPSYEAIAQKVQSGTIPASVEFRTITPAEGQARLAERIDAQKDTNGVVRVIFWTESGFPARHSGYLYSSSGEPGSEIASLWPILKKVRTNWFFISN